MSIQTEIKIEVLEEMTTTIAEKSDNPMASFAMGLHTIMIIDMYEKKLEEKLGTFTNRREEIEEGNFTDENGSGLTDTLTFQNLKKRLVSESE